MKKVQKSLNTTLEKTEQTLGSLENSLGNNEEASLLATAENSEANDGLPEGWQLVSIDDVTFKGEQRKPEDSEELVYVDIGSIDRDKKIISTPQQLLGKDAPSRARRVITKGDVLVSLTRPNLNAVALVSEKYDGQFASTGFEVLKPLGYDSRLLFSITKSKSFIESISGTVQGALYPAAKSADVKSYKIPLPPLAEQTVIAQTLDTLLAQVDNIKTRLDAIPNILKTFRQSVLAAAVSGKLTEEWRGENESSDKLDYKETCISEREEYFDKKIKKLVGIEKNPDIELPKTWVWQSLDESSLRITDGTHFSPKSTSSGDFMYVTSKNVRAGYIDLTKISYVDEITHREIYQRCDVKKDDVLYVKDGANTGLACVNTIEEEISLLSSVGVFKVCSFVNSKYLEHYLNSPTGRKLMLGMMGGTAIPRLTLTKLAKAPFSLPPMIEQTQIVRRVEELFAFADQIEQQVKNAQGRVNNLTQSILAKAFRGELTTQWRAENPDLISGDNSAEALLAKIQEERDALKQKAKTKKKSTAKKTKKKVAEK